MMIFMMVVLFQTHIQGRRSRPGAKPVILTQIPRIFHPSRRILRQKFGTG